MHLRLLPALTLSALCGGALANALASPPQNPKTLSAEIDRHLDRKLAEAKIPASPAADDAEFLRRVYLDLTGKIPTADKARAFLDSTDPERRSKLIDELLASPEYGAHFGNLWCGLIVRPDANMIRPPDTRPFAAWLAQRFNAGQGWDATVRDILTAEGDPKEAPQGVYFILNGDSRGNPQANIITSSTAKLFLGIQLQCAECHAHPFQRDWHQEDYWGMAAFFGKVQLLGGAKGAVGAGVTEKSKGGAGKNNATLIRTNGTSIVIPADSFKQAGKKVPAKVLGGQQPTLDAEQPFRPALATWLTARENPYFARNTVNRLWAHLFGRGFVNPVDDLSGAEASHPELLTSLAGEFAASGFDQKQLLRAICNSNAYQRSSATLPGNKTDEVLFSRMGLKVIGPEVFHDALCLALEIPALTEKPGKPAGKAPKGTPPVVSQGSRDQFVALFTTKGAADDPTEFSHGIPQVLRLMNAPVFNTGGPVVERALKEKSPEKAIESLYLAALSRRPDAGEVREMTAFVSKAKNPRAGYCGALWALVNGGEFMINH